MTLNDFIKTVNEHLNEIGTIRDMYYLCNDLRNLVEKLSDGKLTMNFSDYKCTYGYIASVEYKTVIASVDIKKRKCDTHTDWIYSYTNYTIKAVILSKDCDGNETIENLLNGAKLEREKRENAQLNKEIALIDFLKNYDFASMETIKDVENFKRELLSNHSIFNRLNRFYE